MKIPGVKEVKFKAADPPKDANAPKVAGARKVIVVTEKEGVTKDDAVKALGKKAKRYVVKSWTDPTAKKTEEAKEG